MLALQVSFPLSLLRANSFSLTLLRALQVSCPCFSRAFPLFSATCTLFLQNTAGWGASTASFPHTSSPGHSPTLRGKSSFFILLQTVLGPEKTQPHWNQYLPHSFTRIPEVGYATHMGHRTKRSVGAGCRRDA